jgi:hypothetical protein
MRLFVLGCLMAAVTVRAAPQQQPDKQEMYRMLDEIRASIRLDDWNEAWRLAVRLNASIVERLPRTGASPDLELQHLEFMAGSNAISRGPLLARLARTALAAGDLKKAGATPTKRWRNRSTASSGGPATPFTRGTSCWGGWRCAAERWRGQALPAAGRQDPRQHFAGGAGTQHGAGAGPAGARRIGRGAPVPRGMRLLLEWKPREAGRMDGSHSRRAEAGFRSQRDYRGTEPCNP